MRIITFIEDQRVVRAILVHLLLGGEALPPQAAPFAPVELVYLPWVE